MRWIPWYLAGAILTGIAFVPFALRYQNAQQRPWTAIATMVFVSALLWPILLVAMGRELWTDWTLRIRALISAADLRSVMRSAEHIRTTKRCPRCGATVSPYTVLVVVRVRLRRQAVCMACAALPWWRRW